MKTPNFTPQSIGAFLVLIFSNVLILAGLNIGATREAALDTLINAVAIVAFLVHDAVVRHGRANVAAATVTATPQAPAVPATPQKAAPPAALADAKSGASQ